MRGRERGRAARVIRVLVRHGHDVQVRSGERELSRNRIDMTWIAHPGIDERCRSVVADDEIGVIAGTRHGRGVVGVEGDWDERHQITN
jgi:hypothetical protein